jgi:hypothetical protein
VGELVASLEAAAPRLAEEADRLKALTDRGGALFLQQTECLHDPSRGAWSYLALKGEHRH